MDASSTRPLQLLVMDELRRAGWSRANTSASTFLTKALLIRPAGKDGWQGQAQRRWKALETT